MESDESHESTIARGAGFVLVGTFVGMGASFFIRTWLIRELPKVEYGLFALGLSTASLVATFGTLGLRQGVARAISRADEESAIRATTLTALSSVLVVTLVIFFLSFVFSNKIAVRMFRKPSMQPYLKVFSVLVPTTAVLSVVIAVFRGKKRAQERVLLQSLISPVGRGLLAVIAVLLGYGTLGAAVGWVIGVSIAVAVGIYYLWDRTSTLSVGRFTPRYRSLLGFSLPLMISSATWAFVQQADNFLLGLLKDSADVAVYDGAFLLGKLLLVILGSFGFLFMPIFSELDKNGDEERMQAVYHAVTEWATLLAVPIYVGTVLSPGVLLSVVFKPSYASGGAALSIVASGFFLHTLSGSSGDALVALGRNRIVLVGNVSAGVVNVVLNLLLIPRFGITGAAVASAVSYGLFNIYYLFYLNRLTGLLPISRSFLRSLLLSFLAVSVVWIGVTTAGGANVVTVLTALSMSSVIHAVVVLKTKTMTAGDKRLLSEIGSKLGVDLEETIDAW